MEQVFSSWSSIKCGVQLNVTVISMTLELMPLGGKKKKKALKPLKKMETYNCDELL